MAVRESKESWERLPDGIVVPRMQQGIGDGFPAPPQRTTNVDCAVHRALGGGQSPVRGSGLPTRAISDRTAATRPGTSGHTPLACQMWLSGPITQAHVMPRMGDAAYARGQPATEGVPAGVIPSAAPANSLHHAALPARAGEPAPTPDTGFGAPTSPVTLPPSERPPALAVGVRKPNENNNGPLRKYLP